MVDDSLHRAAGMNPTLAIRKKSRCRNETDPGWDGKNYRR